MAGDANVTWNKKATLAKPGPTVSADGLPAGGLSLLTKAPSAPAGVMLSSSPFLDAFYQLATLPAWAFFFMACHHLVKRFKGGHNGLIRKQRFYSNTPFLL